MIFHLSISADNPKHVASILAEIFQGDFAPFPPHPGSYVSFALDEHGTAIEVYPKGTELNPGAQQEQLQFIQNGSNSKFTATHAAISVPLSQQEIRWVLA